jgi:hypothetical protein
MKAKILIILLLAVITVYLSSERYLWDDAVISYRFCQNLLLGKGLVSYDGGPHVEGYSNPSLVFLTAGIAKVIGVSDIPNILRIGLYLNTLALLVLCWLLLKWGEKDWSWISAFALILFFPVHIYRACGLETCLYTLFFTLSVYGFSEKKYQLGLAASLLTALSRPEGIGLAVWLCAVFLVNGEKKHWQSRLLQICLWVAIPFGLFLTWRYYYFGQLISATSIAKTHLGERGVWQGTGLYYFLKAQKAAPILAILSLLTLARFAHQKSKAIYEITAVTFQVFFIIAVGGDEWFFDKYRFLSPIFPLLFRSLGIIPQGIRKFRPAIILSVPLLIGFYPVSPLGVNNRHFPWVHQIYHEITGLSPKNRFQAFLNPQPFHDELFSLFLRDNVYESGKNLLLTSGQAGALPLHWKGSFHDHVGLVSLEYGSIEARDRKYFFRENQPDIYAEFKSSPENPPKETIRLYSALFTEKELAEMGYKPVLIFMEVWPPFAWNGQINYHEGRDIFFVYAKTPDLIRIENPSWITKSLFNGRIIKIPVIEIQVSA